MNSLRQLLVSGLGFLMLLTTAGGLLPEPAFAGDIVNHGTMTVKGNLVNNNSASSSLGPGVIVMAGTTAQTITGALEFGTLRIANTGSGVTVASGDQKVNTALNLKSGLLTLGSNHLLLGPAATDSGGSASSMVVVTGSGELRKEFASAPATFTYPVGDNDGTAEYSPVTLNFTAGTFPSGNFIGITLADAAVSVPEITAGTHITRNWTLNNSPANTITGFSCTGSFQYLPADVELTGGTESDLYLLKVSPLVTYNQTVASTHTLSGTLESFSTFTGGRPGHEISLTAFLEGPYSSGVMTTTLNTSGKIPLSQPYNIPPWNYTGTESVASIPPGVVDWVLVELRQASLPVNATGATVVSTKAAFINSSGSIVDLDGTSAIKFYNTVITSNLYPVVRHRNHLAIMANNTVTKTNGIYLYDYSSAQNQIYDGTGNGCILLGTVWGMLAGNAYGDRILNNTDYISWQNNFALTNYNPADFNMNGAVNTTDFIIWQKNFSLVSKVPN